MIEWSEQHQMIRDAVRKFIEAEIVPIVEELEHGDTPPYDALPAYDGSNERVIVDAAIAAGVDPTTVARLTASGIDAHAALADNDTGTALATVGDTIRTGPTGTNVCDVTMVLTAAR